MGRLILSAFAFLLVSSTAHALPFKCDKDQTVCEIQTKRWTIGDKVGIFTSEKELVAVGEVTEIRDQRRMVKITKRWAPLLRSHDADIIDDSQYQTPSASFRIVKPLSPMLWAADLGMLNVGVGDGFIATTLSGYVYRLFWRDVSWYGRFHFLTGSGTASDNLGNAGKQNVDVMGYGLTGGLSQMLLPFHTISVRLNGELGFTYGDVKLGGNFDEGSVLNDRFNDGMGVNLGFSVAGVWRRDGIQPEFGLEFTHIHNSNNTGLFIGFNRPFSL